MTVRSGQTTGNVPIEAIDPGGTRKAPTGDTAKQPLSNKIRPPVQSGDRNTVPSADIHDNDANAGET